MKTAETWDSYRPYMSAILGEMNIRKYFEWGSGKSTKLVDSLGISVDSVEHSAKWFDKTKSEVSNNVNLIFENDIMLYPCVTGRYDKYDFIFVDGAERERCIKHSHNMLEDNGIVMVHDAEREQYHPYMNEYKHLYFYDDGHTAVMTNNKHKAYEIGKLFGDLNESSYSPT